MVHTLKKRTYNLQFKKFSHIVRYKNIRNELENMWFIYAMEYYSAMGKDILLFATWMDLEHIM